MKKFSFALVAILIFAGVAGLYWWLLRNSPAPVSKSSSDSSVRVFYITRAEQVSDRWLTSQYLQPLYFGPPREAIEKTVEELKKEIENNPKNVKAVSDLAILLAQNRQWEESLTYARRWTELASDPTDSLDAWLGVAYALVNLWRLREAIEALDEAIARSTTRVSRALLLAVQGEIYLILAGEDINERESLVSQSGRCFHKALELSPDLSRALLGKARWHIHRYLWGMGAKEEELKHSEQLIDRLYTVGVVNKREQALVAYYRGQLYELRGEQSLAQEYYRAAIKADPTSFALINISK